MFTWKCDPRFATLEYKSFIIDGFPFESPKVEEWTIAQKGSWDDGEECRPVSAAIYLEDNRGKSVALARFQNKRAEELIAYLVDKKVFYSLIEAQLYVEDILVKFFNSKLKD